MSSSENAFFLANSESTLLSSLPSINLSFDEMKVKMMQFTAKFDKFVMDTKEKQLEAKNNYSKAIAGDREIQKSLQKQIENYKKIEEDTFLAIEKEKQEIAEAERSIAEFTEKKAMMLEKKEYLSQKIQDINQAIQKKRERRANMRHMLIKQASKNQPELQFWEDYLSMKIEGVKDDFLKIIFTHIDENDWEREFYFVINLSKRDYESRQQNKYFATQSWPVMLSKKRIFVYSAAGVAVWVFALGLSFNHQRFISPVVSYLIYQLKCSPIAQSYLGENIDFTCKWPWISGEINYLKGRIDLSFRVGGSQYIEDRATVKFKSVRKSSNSEWITLVWAIFPDKSSQEVSLLQELSLTHE
ncbi:hypothetical protein PORY_001519 [Pneumocystis oryctolagi]|uniref:Uncharacterized protein n=1 Tax=Pneumocystis oryctolagi TaxID=42067 RepID=A0ACB7CC76_9ASCO|nr:hypothetical protein PORY_001519 [Pneumocystis oryctolagi]